MRLFFFSERWDFLDRSIFYLWKNNRSTGTAPSPDSSMPPPALVSSVLPPALDSSVPPPALVSSVPPPALNSSVPPPALDSSVPPPALETRVCPLQPRNLLVSLYLQYKWTSSLTNSNVCVLKEKILRFNCEFNLGELMNRLQTDVLKNFNFS